MFIKSSQWTCRRVHLDFPQQKYWHCDKRNKYDFHPEYIIHVMTYMISSWNCITGVIRVWNRLQCISDESRSNRSRCCTQSVNDACISPLMRMHIIRDRETKASECRIMQVRITHSHINMHVDFNLSSHSLVAQLLISEKLCMMGAIAGNRS